MEPALKPVNSEEEQRRQTHTTFASRLYLVFLSAASVSCSLETLFSNWSITSVPCSSKNADTDLVKSASLDFLDFPSVKDTRSVYWSSNLENTDAN